MTENPGKTIELTKRSTGCPTVTAIIQGSELDEQELPDAIDAALSRCSILDSAEDIGRYLYNTLNRTFDVTTIEIKW